MRTSPFPMLRRDLSLASGAISRLLAAFWRLFSLMYDVMSWVTSVRAISVPEALPRKLQSSSLMSAGLAKPLGARLTPSAGVAVLRLRFCLRLASRM